MVKNILRRLSRPLNFDEGDDLAALDEAAAGSPRAAAIVATSLVEDALRWCLCGFLIPAGAEHAELSAEDQAAVFDSETAPLNSFHAKIVIGYSLGIYGQVTRDDLQRMKFIRNAFAHSPRAITFDTPKVTKLCLELGYMDHVLANTNNRAIRPTPIPKDTNPRQKLLDTARLLIIDLHAIGFADSEHAKDVGEMP